MTFLRAFGTACAVSLIAGTASANVLQNGGFANGGKVSYSVQAENCDVFGSGSKGSADLPNHWSFPECDPDLLYYNPYNAVDANTKDVNYGGDASYAKSANVVDPPSGGGGVWLSLAYEPRERQREAGTGKPLFYARTSDQPLYFARRGKNGEKLYTAVKDGTNGVAVEFKKDRALFCVETGVDGECFFTTENNGNPALTTKKNDYKAYFNTISGKVGQQVDGLDKNEMYTLSWDAANFGLKLGDFRANDTAKLVFMIGDILIGETSPLVYGTGWLSESIDFLMPVKSGFFSIGIMPLDTSKTNPQVYSYLSIDNIKLKRTPTPVVPVPNSLPLLLAGVGGLVFLRRRKS